MMEVKEKNIKRRILIIIGIILIFSGLFGIELYQSANQLTINMLSYVSNKINDSVRIVIIGDLHNHDFGDKLVSKVQEKKPDLILMAGDMIDQEKADEEQIYTLIEELKDTAPVIYAIGNHEVNYIKKNPKYYEQLRESGCTILDQEYLDMDIKGQTIRIGGLYDYPFGMADNHAETAPEDIRTFINDFCDTDEFKLMIAHRPDSFVFGNTADVYDIDLVVSAHLHGGQVVVPFKGGLYGGDQGWFPKYVHGMYEKGNIHLLITSGLGSSSQKLPRFLNPPEIMVLELE